MPVPTIGGRRSLRPLITRNSPTALLRRAVKENLHRAIKTLFLAGRGTPPRGPCSPVAGSSPRLPPAARIDRG